MCAYACVSVCLYIYIHQVYDIDMIYIFIFHILGHSARFHLQTDSMETNMQIKLSALGDRQ